MIANTRGRAALSSPLDKPYVFGYIQGCSMIAFGLFVGIPAVDAPHFKFGGFLYASLWILSGIVVVTRWSIYGLGLLYMALFLTGVMIFKSAETFASFLVGLIALFWFGIPALLYFPTHLPVFRYEGDVRSVPREELKEEQKSIDVTPVFPRDHLEDREIDQVWQHMRERHQRGGSKMRE